jgi:hypothetical protein
MQEIISSKTFLSRGIAPEARIYENVLADIGRLSTACLEKLIEFHSELALWSKLDPSSQVATVTAVEAAADLPIASFQTFMRDTRRELDEAHAEIKRLKL